MLRCERHNPHNNNDSRNDNNNDNNEKNDINCDCQVFSLGHQMINGTITELNRVGAGGNMEVHMGHMVRHENVNHFLLKNLDLPYYKIQGSFQQQPQMGIAIPVQVGAGCATHVLEGRFPSNLFVFWG